MIDGQKRRIHASSAPIITIARKIGATGFPAPSAALFRSSPHHNRGLVSRELLHIAPHTHAHIYNTAPIHRLRRVCLFLSILLYTTGCLSLSSTCLSFFQGKGRRRITQAHTIVTRSLARGQQSIVFYISARSISRASSRLSLSLFLACAAREKKGKIKNHGTHAARRSHNFV